MNFPYNKLRKFEDVQKNFDYLAGKLPNQSVTKYTHTWPGALTLMGVSIPHALGSVPSGGHVTVNDFVSVGQIVLAVIDLPTSDKTTTRVILQSTGAAPTVGTTMRLTVTVYA